MGGLNLGHKPDDYFIDKFCLSSAGNLLAYLIPILLAALLSNFVTILFPHYYPKGTGTPFTDSISWGTIFSGYLG